MINMATVPPTVTDVSRAILNLAEIGEREPEVWEDDDRWGVGAMRENAAINIFRWIQPVASLRKLNRREVGLIMATHGATPALIANHATEICKIIKRDFRLMQDSGNRLL